MKNIELIHLSRLLPKAFAGEKLPFKLRYAISKNADMLQAEAKHLFAAIDGLKSDELKAALDQSYKEREQHYRELAKINPGTDGTESERYALQQLGKGEALMNEYEQFAIERKAVMTDENEISLYKVSLSVVEELNLDDTQMHVLNYFLDED